MNRTAAVLAASLVVGAVAAPAAVAGPKRKPITKTYTASAPMFDPTNWATPVAKYSVCAQNVPDSYHVEPFKVPAAGRLKIELTDYSLGPLNDWDLLLVNGAKEEIAASGSGGAGGPEVIDMKFKKGEAVEIIACNWSGGPTGKVKYTFTFA